MSATDTHMYFILINYAVLLRINLIQTHELIRFVAGGGKNEIKVGNKGRWVGF